MNDSGFVICASNIEYCFTVKPQSYFAEYIFRLFTIFSNREQSETNQNDENAMCDYL